MNTIKELENPIKARIIKMLPQFGLPLATIALFIYLSIVSPHFLTGTNIQNISRQIASLAITAFGQAMVIMTAGLDLSVGAIMALVSVVLAYSTLKYSLFVGIIAALAIGVVVGLFNGTIITKFNISPFIVTMGVASIMRGIALTLTGGTPVSGMPPSFAYIGHNSVLGVPIPIIIAFIAFAISCFVLAMTSFGRHIYAIGGNREASRLSGVRVDFSLINVYIFCSVLAAIAGIILTSRVRSGQPTLGTGYDLQSVAAVVLGGVSLNGGRGSLPGVFVGVLFIGFLNNGLNLLNVSSYTQQIIIGTVLIVAIALDSILSDEKSYHNKVLGIFGNRRRGKKEGKSVAK